ncbi:putative toxin-antitoxin system toxin component, PIN family [Runella slithyformis]|uniref:putative toxin-antitoxin system toxin component, PIN family n=1 Tax=Runella slithyformis TaxID=106 RepID=UPI000693D4F1|nr:putative toxin-antitoxin system toxin component, PIN family [Runella slithyformis]
MRVVLDTNVVLRALSSKSALRLIVDALYEAQYELIVSNEVLFEYTEKINQFYGFATTESFIAFLQLLPNVKHIEPHFHLNLITIDPDDNRWYCLKMQV